MTSAANVVREQQREWARRRGIRFDSAGYTFDLADNLFAPLSAATEQEFRSGDGDELGREGERGKMQALHSSSALACNVFDHWRGRDTSTLARALGLSTSAVDVAFEQKYPTGLVGHAPNLDVVLRPSTGPVTAIESKFLEPYGTHGSGFRPKYFESRDGLWTREGYRGCQALAEALDSGDTVFTWLHAEQLLKHILGLVHSARGPWKLVYLWYEVPGPETDEHAAEAAEFAGVMRADGIDFESLSYQTVFANLRDRVGDDARKYVDYLGDRYFGASE